ncbi:TapB family protein [Enhygromyxa salina]|uniref:DUF3108 domain-containing protein n=1 Tax=Enhygromyxa salina TaxID=215803 RepID=A0A2S9XT15_9BACT|nr:hypothetical protein [Enhygromyxa salina]PRP96003.1 hypothetical protein ENSA7_68170 [Enhygromyxa salina]
MTEIIFSKTMFAISMLALPLALVACGQAAPPGDEASTDTSSESTDTGSVEEDDSYYPLVDGATWTYVASTTTGQVLGMEVVEASEITWEGAPAWVFTDNPNDLGEWTESTIVRTGSAAMRVHKEIKDGTGTTMIVDYDPGFMRADDKWDTVGFIEEILYGRNETDGAGLNPKFEPRGHSYEVLAVNETVTVPAGTFNCIKVERIRTVGTTAGERVLFWDARGVGKVREERPAEGRVEELASVSIPGGASFP